MSGKPTPKRPPSMRYHCRAGDQPPRIGQWLATPNGRNGYHVVGIRPGRVGIAGTRVFVLSLERTKIDNIPDGADVFTFEWLPRGRKRR